MKFGVTTRLSPRNPISNYEFREDQCSGRHTVKPRYSALCSAQLMSVDRNTEHWGIPVCRIPWALSENGAISERLDAAGV